MSEHAEMFGRAALIARDPDNFESVDLLDDEREALIYERDHKWHGSKMLWYSIGLCAVGAATQGWDQTGANGANLSFPKEFGIDGEGTDEWIVGIINSIIFLTAGLIGAFIVDPLNHYFGRRGEIFITAACLTATPIASGFSRNWQELFAIRFIMGIGIGAKNATVPIYSAEMAPARIRGALVMFWQLWVVIGKSISQGTHDNNTNSNRYLPRFLRQRHRQGHWSHRLASRTRLRLHPRLPPHGRHLLLPRITPLADEARQDLARLRLYGQAPSSPHHRCPRLLLLLRHLP